VVALPAADGTTYSAEAALMLIWLWIRMKRRRAEKAAAAQQAGAATIGGPMSPAP
jgi:hypothetical protein